MRIGMAATDVGPSNMFKMVVPVLEKGDHQVIIAPAIKRWPSDLVDELLTADVVATGYGSIKSDQEVFLIGCLHGGGVTHVLVEDVPDGVVGRVSERAPALISGVDSLVVALPTSIRKAKELGFTDVVAITPPHWGPSYQAMVDQTASRDGLMVELAGKKRTLEDHEPLIVVWGTKELALELEMLRQAIAAATKFFGREGFVVGHHAHPALLKQFEVNQAIDLPGAGEIFAHVPRLITEGLTITRALRVADVRICSGGPMESIVCAFARLPVIYYAGSYQGGTVIDRNRYQGLPDGQWFVPALGGALVADEDDFLDILESSRDAGVLASLLATQEKNFPVPENWDTASILADHLVSVAWRFKVIAPS